MLICERLHQVHAICVGGIKHGTRVGLAWRERLLAQNVLACIQRTNGPFCMHSIRQRHIHRLHLRVGEQLVKAVVANLEPILLAELRDLFGIPARNSV